MKNPIQRKNAVIALILSLVLIFGGAIWAKSAHTSGGEVAIKDISFVTEDGGLLRALLYLPKSATPTNPAPAIVSSHGYNNTAEVQDINTVELSRRGFVVIAIDAYGHGSSELPDLNVNEGIVADMGTYAAMQYLKTLPYVDVTRVGMIGHSMGATAIQKGAQRAIEAQKTDPNVVVPFALLPTANSFEIVGEGDSAVSLFEGFPINLGVVYGQFDEWAPGMWGVEKGSDINTTIKAKATMGFDLPEYGVYYAYGENTPLNESSAVAAAKEGNLRVIFQPPHTHPVIHFNAESAQNVVDFFAITLNEGNTVIPSNNHAFFSKQMGTGISMIGYFVLIVALGLFLLTTPFFASIIRPEPNGLTAINKGSDWVRYWVIFIIGALPAPLLYNWLVGYPINIAAQGRAVPIIMNASKVFPLPAVNGIFLLNIITAAITMVLYLIVFFGIAKKAGATIQNTGVSLPGKEIAKAALLAVTVFLGSYLAIVLCDYFFKTDMRFFTISIKTLTPVKWGIFLKYMPSFLIFFVVSAISQNTFTRINNKKEWLNIILIILSSFVGLLVLHLLDYVSLMNTGIKMFTTVPGQGTTAALAGVLLWGLLVILPIGAVISRIFFKKTGSVWTGAFINALVVTLYAISNTVIAARIF